MDLKLSIIIEKLREKGICVEKKQETDPFIQSVSYACTHEEFTGESILSRVWVFDKRNMHLLETFKKKYDKEGFCYILCGDEAGESEKVIGAVGNIIAEFSYWRERILLKMLEKDDMQSIIDYMGTKVSNPFVLLDDNGFILARSKGHESIPDGTIWDTMKGNYLNLYDFYSPKEWKKIRHQMDAAGHKHVLFRPEKDVRHIYYAITLYDHGHTIGSIGAMDINGPFTDGQIAIMEMIRDMLEVYLRAEYNAAESGSIITPSFNRLINGDYDLNAVRKSLNKKHWKTDDFFYLLTFDFPEIVNSEIELASWMNLLRMQFPKSMIGLLNKQIVLVVSRKDHDWNDQKQKEALERFLVQYDLYCGISYSFKNFENCRCFCEQSSFAALIASQVVESVEGVGRIVEYKNVQMEHMIRLMRKDEVKKYCHPAILMLHSSPKKSDQILISCLKSYLTNGRSIAHAAQALDMHRNTLIYRLERLEEILEVHFEYLTDDEIMGLLMSCYIVDGV